MCTASSLKKNSRVSLLAVLACSGSFPENILSRGIFVEGQNGESSRFVIADLKKNRPEVGP